MWNWSIFLALAIVVPVTYLLFFNKGVSGTKPKSKSANSIKVDSFKETPKSSPKSGKKSKASKKEVKKPEPEIAPVEPSADSEPASDAPAAPKPKKNKKKKAATIVTEKDSAKSAIESPAPTPELIPDHIENSVTDTQEASKSKKKKNKKKNVTTEDSSPAIVSESIIPTEVPVEVFDDPSFSKPTKVSMSRVQNSKGLSESKPVETKNPWALLGDSDI